MTATPLPKPVKFEGDEATRSLLSSDPATQAIELAFLARWLAASEAASAQILQRAREGRMPETVEELQLVQSRLFGELARILESSVERRVGFGRFDER